MKTFVKFGALLVAFVFALFGAVPTPTKKPAPKTQTTLPTVTVLGRLGRDPEVKVVGEKTVTEFSIAEDHFTGEKDADGKAIKTAVWYKVACWNGLGERVQNLTKGQEVVVRGTLKVAPGKKAGMEFRDITAAVVRLTASLPEAAPQEPSDEEMPD